MRIVFIDGTKGFSPTRLSEKPCGGIITSLTKIPRHLADAGHAVTVLSCHPVDEHLCGVHYRPVGTDLATMLPPDVVVFNRNCIDRQIATYFKMQGAKIVWWLHDVVDPRYLSDDGFMLADRVIALSDYCRRAYADFYGMYKDVYTIIPNGVDRGTFFPGDEPRRRQLFVCASAPIKGLYPLAFTWHNIRRALPDAELRLYSSQKLHDLENTAEHARQLAELEKAGAKIMDPIPQKDLAAVFRQATALLMPNNYPEICSNVLLQAQACGLPVVASNIGSASEFIDHRKTGMLTHTRPDDLFWWHKDFATQVMHLVDSQDLRERISEQSPVGTKSWWEIGQLWEKMVAELYSKTLVSAGGS